MTGYRQPRVFGPLAQPTSVLAYIVILEEGTCDKKGNHHCRQAPLRVPHQTHLVGWHVEGGSSNAWTHSTAPCLLPRPSNRGQETARTQTHTHTAPCAAATAGELSGCAQRPGESHLSEAALPEEGSSVLLLAEGGDSLVEQQVGLFASQLIHRHCQTTRNTIVHPHRTLYQHPIDGHIPSLTSLSSNLNQMLRLLFLAYAM